MEDENEDPWVPNQGAEKGQKWLKLTKVLNLFYFAPIQFTQATNFHYFYTDRRRGEQQKMKDEYEDP